MLLGLDLGTTNVKAVVVSPSGELRGRGQCGVGLFHLENGGVEQDLEEIWTAALSAVQQAVRAAGSATIQAVGVSSQGGAMQILDGEGKAVGRVVSWLDRRGRADGTALIEELGSKWFAQRIGHGRAGMAIGQLLRLRRECPGRLAPPHRIGFVGDLVVARLCGRAAQDGTSAGLTLLYNPSLREYDPELLARLGVGPEQLPALESPRASAGRISAEISRLTDLPAGIPVSVAIHDQYAAALGTGAVRPGTTMVGAGTAWVLLAVSGRPVEPVVPSAYVNHHVVEGLYGEILSLVNGGSALAWVAGLVGVKDAGEIERLLGSVPAGSDGLCFWPFLAPSPAAGLRANHPGGVSGLRLSHGPAHLLRAAVEGLAFELKRHLTFFEAAPRPVERLVMGGTAAASRVTPEIIANVTGLPLKCLPEPAGSALGAAILARGLAEPNRSLAELSDEMLPPRREVLPGPEQALYAERYKEYLGAVPSSPATD